MKKIFTLIALLGLPSFALAQNVSPRDQGLSHWQAVYDVLSHPRCANCHVGDEGIPMWSGPSYGLSPREHGMNIKAGESRFGIESLPCSTCHGTRNVDLPHGAPGAEGWRLPPSEFQWFDKSSREVCEQLQDPERNGGKAIWEVAEHVNHDALVAWGWDPGPGREAAPSSAEETAAHIMAWGEAGAPCPAE